MSNEINRSVIKPTYFKLIPEENLRVQLKLRDDVKQKKVEEMLRPLILSEETIDKVGRVFQSELEIGLSKNGLKKSSLHMMNTFLPELPNGQEEGEFVALDLGGSNIRVSWVQMQSGQIVAFKDKHFTLTTNIQQGPGTQLFDFLAECIIVTLEEFDLCDKELPLGFTFSFPMVQRALDVGVLASWTKAFNCPGVVGKDVVKLLNDALCAKGNTNVHVVAVLNDMTGILVQGAYLDHRTTIGIGIGTGANACYLEDVDKVEYWDGHLKGGQVAIDTELGGFGDNGVLDFIKTEFDEEVDSNSLLRKSFTFEKYISGIYLGEVVRCILSKMIKADVLFTQKPVVVIHERDTFPTRYISQIESDFSADNFSNTAHVLRELDVLDASSDDDVAIVRYVSALASIRASQLIAVCLAKLIERSYSDDVTVAVDGSVYKRHPKMHSLITHFVAERVPQNKRFRLMLADDGSGKGAALVAAIAVRVMNRAD